MEIPITFNSDEKGYFDRECPNENCQFTFKIMMEDWKNKVSDDEVHCPMCGCVETSDKWWTQTQIDEMKEIATNWAMNYIRTELDKSFKKLEYSTRNNKFIKIKYKPGRRITFINNPIGALEEWETDITCEKCGTRYSVIGSAYFCPCCGYNSVESSFYESLDSVEKMIDSLQQMREIFTNNYGRDKAETMCRSMLEGTIGDIVSAFQKYACSIYERISGENARVNDFQMIDKGSDLFEKATGFKYDSILTEEELEELNCLFQKRHILEHNDGIIDQKYIDKSGDSEYLVGQRLVVHKKDGKRLLFLIRKLSDGIKNTERQEG